MTTAISQLLYLLDDAFEGTPRVSLLGNLKTLEAEDWLWVPHGGQRSVRDIVQHVGGCKFMYDDYAFGEGATAWTILSLMAAKPLQMLRQRLSG